jgi:hypothetical protein
VQLTIDRIDRVSISGTDERAARRALRAQVAKLERELSAIIAEGFPHIAPRAHTGATGGAPCLLDLGRLECTRDELAGMVASARRARMERVELETRSRELLRRMQREPAAYKFVRLPVRDLGEHGCGVWQVRPRLGLIGMLAGWWQVKLSSGCPLPGGHAAAWPGDLITPEDRDRSRRHPGATSWRGPEVVHGAGARALQHRDQGLALAFGHRSDRLLLGHRQLSQELAAAGLTPATLAHQQVRDGHAVGLPGAVEEHVGDVDLPGRDPSLELGASEANLVGAFEGAHVLRGPARPAGRDDRRGRVHDETLPVAAALARRATFDA